MSEKDRFDLEQAIMNCWHTSDDIELIIPQLLEGELDTDDVANLLLGIKELHNLRARQAMDILEQMVCDGAFSSANYESQCSKNCSNNKN